MASCDDARIGAVNAFAFAFVSGSGTFLDKHMNLFTRGLKKSQYLAELCKCGLKSQLLACVK